MADQTVSDQPVSGQPVSDQPGAHQEGTTNWLTDVLWPGAHTTPGWWGRSTRRFVAVPSGDAPTQLLPWSLGSCRAAANRRSDDRRRIRSVADGVGVLGLIALAPIRSRSRLALRTSTGQSLVEHMRAQIDPAITSAVVLCGPPRANQKPVLQLLDRWGGTVAFAKVAWNELTRELIAAEHAALLRLASVPDRGFVAPQVIATGDFSGGSWLAITPAAVGKRQATSAEAVSRLALAVEQTGPTWSGRTADSAFIDHLQRVSSDLPRGASVVRRLVEAHRDDPISLCPSHGDFVPWNILSGQPSPALWDWERYDLLRPVGFDRLHHAFQLHVARRGRSPAVAAAQVWASLATILPELDAPTAALHFEWYLADVMCRYERDGLLTGVTSTATRGAQIADIIEQTGSPQ